MVTINGQYIMRGYLRPSDHPDAHAYCDRTIRKRKQCGSHPNHKTKAKLNKKQIQWARRMYGQQCMTLTEIAKELGISRPATSLMARRLTYKEACYG